MQPQISASLCASPGTFTANCLLARRLAEKGVRFIQLYHAFHATILNQLGIDHTRLTYMFQGRRYRLTDVHGHVVKDLLVQPSMVSGKWIP